MAAPRPVPPVYVSTGAVADAPLSAVLDQLQAWGAECIELGSAVRHAADNVAVAVARAESIPLLVHNYFPAPADPFVLNLAAADEDVLRRSRAHCRACLDLTARIGAPFYAAHAGFAFLPKPEHLGRTFTGGAVAPRAEALERFRDSVIQLLDHARGLGVSFLVENNVCAPFNAPDGVNDKLLLADPTEMLDFARQVGREDFGYLIDAAHLKVSARTLGFDLSDAMERLLPLTRAFHLSDNDGTADTNHAFGMDAWFLPFLARVPVHAIVIEVGDVSYAALSECLCAVRKALESV